LCLLCVNILQWPTTSRMPPYLATSPFWAATPLHIMTSDHGEHTKECHLNKCRFVCLDLFMNLHVLLDEKELSNMSGPLIHPCEKLFCLLFCCWLNNSKCVLLTKFGIFKTNLTSFSPRGCFVSPLIISTECLM
jgi:hypothetical protein